MTLCSHLKSGQACRRVDRHDRWRYGSPWPYQSLITRRLFRAARGFNEDFGFPNSAKLAIQPSSLLQPGEATLMVTIGALEAIGTGTTTLVEMSSGISPHASALAQSGLRMVLAETVRDSENVAGPMSPEGLAQSVTPRFSPKLRDEGMQRINDLFEVMRIALLTERIQRNDAFPGVRPQPEDMLEDASLVGSLEVGKKADLLVNDRRSVRYAEPESPDDG